jgi:putative exporter of polyketide antibiotics
VALKLLKSINLTYFSSNFKHIKVTDLYQINATVIIGVLIFLTLGGSSNVTPSSGMTKPSSLLVGVMTASIVFPFALSVIRVAIKNSVDFGIKLTIAGFVYLMVTVILLAFIL